MMTLEVGSLANLAAGRNRPELHDLPRLAIEEFQLRGLTLRASLLTGRTGRDLDRLRDAADKVACPCLTLIDDVELDLASADPEVGSQAMDRLHRLAVVASRLGCSGLGISCRAAAGADLDALAVAVRRGLQSIEKHELNLLLAPSVKDGALVQVEAMTDLIRRVGGFRIGCMPGFAHAARSADAEATLRRLAPYSTVILAELDAVFGTSAKIADAAWTRLGEFVAAIRAVNFSSTLALSSRAKDAPNRIRLAREHLEGALAAVPDADEEA